MNASAPLIDFAKTQLLDAEWQRLQLLGYCAARARQGDTIADTELEQLETLQTQVEELRQPQGLWQTLLNIQLSGIEWDILVAALGPEMDPRLALTYQSLNHSQDSQYPTRALIQELLALSPHQGGLLHQALNPQSVLIKEKLLNVESLDSFSAIKPESWVIAKLLGQPVIYPAPKGSVKVHQTAQWQDLILPDSKLRQLKEFLIWIQHRETVVKQWGGQQVGGPVALFAGPSGTGKTLAASVIANQLDWPLYRVDLGRLVSKYIGETEKNLNTLFQNAQGRPMVLLFDEADSLFAKRGEVKEAKDRYANMEVSHLLSAIEAHQGPCILTTNLRKQMDSAFTRRFQQVIEFTRPDIKQRGLLWHHLLPPKAPLHEEINPQQIGEAVNLTGGAIKNAALLSAYLAAEDQSPIRLSHIALAVWRELTKESREVSLTELGFLKDHLAQEWIHD